VAVHAARGAATPLDSVPYLDHSPRSRRHRCRSISALGDGGDLLDLQFMDIHLLSRFVVAALLATSAIAKWADLRWFATVVASYRVTPRKLSGLTALVVAASETTISVLLFSGQLAVLASWAAFGLVTIFSGVVVLNLLRGRNDLECGCSGPKARTRISWSGVVRNVGIAQLCLLSALSTVGGGSLEASLFCAGVVLLVWPTISRLASRPEAPSTSPLR
jgi:uncharacterized membrane protein YphA (DoxX/SURF4 family)